MTRRETMLLAVDIGNTTVALGLFKGKKLVKSWKLKTDRDRTSDDYGATLLDLLRISGQDPGAVAGAIVSSVVPPLTPVFEDVCRSFFGVQARIVGPGLKTGMPILYENPL
jgi:type III pantothenate kinase